MPQPSSPSAGATYLDRNRRIAELRDSAERARRLLTAIDRMILFGSLVHGIPTPTSDADILVILQHSDIDRPRDRVTPLLAAMSPLPCPVDVFVWTVEEFRAAQRENSPFLREALTHGLDLLTLG